MHKKSPFPIPHFPLLKAMMQLYRQAGQLDKYPTLKSKLGDEMEAFATSPLLKIDAVALGEPFSNYSRLVANVVDRPGLIHMCAFEPNGFDHFYPV